MARSGVGKSKKRAAKMADDAGTELAPSTSRQRSASAASADLPARLRLLEEELEEARARIRLLEQEREQVRNRIDWVIDSLHNVIGE
jgi:chromosome segregation ATPase